MDATVVEAERQAPVQTTAAQEAQTHWVGAVSEQIDGAAESEAAPTATATQVALVPNEQGQYRAFGRGSEAPLPISQFTPDQNTTLGDGVIDDRDHKIYEQVRAELSKMSLTPELRNQLFSIDAGEFGGGSQLYMASNADQGSNASDVIVSRVGGIGPFGGDYVAQLLDGKNIGYAESVRRNGQAPGSSEEAARWYAEDKGLTLDQPPIVRSEPVQGQALPTDKADASQIAEPAIDLTNLVDQATAPEIGTREEVLEQLNNYNHQLYHGMYNDHGNGYRYVGEPIAYLERLAQHPELWSDPAVRDAAYDLYDDVLPREIHRATGDNDTARWTFVDNETRLGIYAAISKQIGGELGADLYARAEFRTKIPRLT